MNEYINNNKKAVIVLHEIYGINRFIEDICFEYQMRGFDVFCPDMLGRTCFPYSEVSEAYEYFIHQVGFETYKKIDLLLEQLKQKYDQVLIIGFSVGATIAWRCCENRKCNGILCCYGSRIRDYLSLQPRCPVLLLFAEQDSFDVNGVIRQLRDKPNAEIHELKARHGYMNPYSEFYEEKQAAASRVFIEGFIKRCINHGRS